MNKNKIKYLAIKWLFELIIPLLILYITVELTIKTESWLFILILPGMFFMIIVNAKVYFKYFKEDEAEQDKD